MPMPARDERTSPYTESVFLPVNLIMDSRPSFYTPLLKYSPPHLTVWTGIHSSLITFRSQHHYQLSPSSHPEWSHGIQPGSMCEYTRTSTLSNCSGVVWGGVGGSCGAAGGEEAPSVHRMYIRTPSKRPERHILNPTGLWCGLAPSAAPQLDPGPTVISLCEYNKLVPRRTIQVILACPKG